MQVPFYLENDMPYDKKIHACSGLLIAIAGRCAVMRLLG